MSGHMCGHKIMMNALESAQATTSLKAGPPLLFAKVASCAQRQMNVAVRSCHLVCGQRSKPCFQCN